MRATKDQSIEKLTELFLATMNVNCLSLLWGPDRLLCLPPGVDDWFSDKAGFDFVSEPEHRGS